MHKQLILRVYLGLELEDFTYQRKDFIIRIPQVYETIEKYNYVMYKNPDYSTKYYYAYITDIRYINDNMTEVTIKTDVFQTWQFDFIYMRSFVEREHVNNDTIGLHTIPESVERGEYIVNNYDSYNEYEAYDIVVLASKPVNMTQQIIPERASQTIQLGGVPFYRLVLCNRFSSVCLWI